MGVCEKCGVEYSDKVLVIHRGICRGGQQAVGLDPEIVDPVENKEEPLDIQKGLIMAELDERGINYNKKKSKEILLDLLNSAKEKDE